MATDAKIGIEMPIAVEGRPVIAGHFVSRRVLRAGALLGVSAAPALFQKLSDALEKRGLDPVDHECISREAVDDQHVMRGIWFLLVRRKTAEQLDE